MRKFKVGDFVVLHGLSEFWNNKLFYVMMLHQEGGYLLCDSEGDPIVSVDEENMSLVTYPPEAGRL